MDKMERKKRRRRIRLIKSLVLVVAFVIAIGATFGITMAYFGGTSDPATGTLTLKTGIWINADDLTTVSGSQYVVPSQVVESECVVTIKSSKASTDTAVTRDQASKALLRATIAITDEVSSAISSTATADSFTVYKSDGSTVAGVFVRDTTETSANIYYFMPSGTTTFNASDTMQEVDTTSGEVTYKFKIKITIPSTLGNSAGGTNVGVSVTYQAVQSDFYNTDGTLIDKTVTNAKTIFDGTSVSANY